MGLCGEEVVIKLAFVVCLVFCGSLWAGAVRLVNDTAYRLRAVIRAADGTYLGELVVMPGKTMQWTDYWGGIGYYNQSQTPYTVAWFCLDGGDSFSICNQVPSGGTVTAFSCDGIRQCPAQKKKGPPPAQGAPAEQYLDSKSD